jgi:hypothetical protein
MGVYMDEHEGRAKVVRGGSGRRGRWSMKRTWLVVGAVGSVGARGAEAPEEVEVGEVGYEFRGRASGGSGGEWRFRVEVQAEPGAVPAVVGEVKLLKGDAETSYTGFGGGIELPNTVNNSGNSYRVTSYENPLFEGSNVTGIYFSYPSYLAKLDPSEEQGFGTGVISSFLLL